MAIIIRSIIIMFQWLLRVKDYWHFDVSIF